MALFTPPAVRAFGALRLVRGGVEDELRRRRERNVLAILVGARGRPVSADRLVVEVWGEQAPAQALASLQVAVSRLRVLLEPDRAPRAPAQRLRSTASGYALDLPTEAVDAWAFRDLVERASSAAEPSERLQAASAACAMWTGEPFAGCDADTARREADALTELHLVAQEVRARALLDLGQPERALADLANLAPDHPYRERLWMLLALTQYRCAQQAAALASLRALRARLAEDLGIDPTPEVAELERALLNQDDPALAATAPAAAAGRPRPSPRPGTVGRDSALGAMHDALAALGESAAFLLVSGEPGIGKSRLVADLGTLAAARGVQIVVGRCHEGEFAPALWPWLPVLRVLHAQAPNHPDVLLQPVLSESTDPVEADGGGVLRLFDAVGTLLEQAATRGPLVIVLEDLHWADATSLRLLGHLAGADLAAPLLVAGTFRTTDAPTSPALIAALAALARAGATRIRLDGLGPDGVAALLGEVIDAPDPRLAAVVAEATGGNPFFVLEYARLIQGRPDLGAVDPALLPVPDGVRDVLRQRLGRLPGEAQAVLLTAAVVGHSIDPDLLARLTGTPVERVLDRLDLALASGILSDDAYGYAFAHALTRETLAAELSAARRMRLHDAVARDLSERAGADPDAAAEVAHHAYLAAPLGPEHAARAGAALARAARVAESRQAPDEALGLWHHAHATAAGPDAGLRRVEARCGQARALLRLSRMGEARTAVADAVRVAGELDRWDLAADAASILNRAGVWAWREHGVQDEAFVATLTEALEHVDDARRARLLATLQIEHYYAWDQDRADEVGEESVRVARRADDPAVLVDVLLANVLATFGPGKVLRRLARIEELRRHSLPGELALFAEFFYARTLHECARVPEADAAAARCTAAAAQLRHTGVEIPLAWWLLARARSREDRPAEAAALDVLHAQHRRGVMSGAGLDVFYALRTAPAGSPVEPALIEAARGTPPGMRALVAYAVLESGDAQTALDVLGPPAPSGASDYSVLAGDCLRVPVLAVAGTREDLRDALRRIENYSGEVVNYGSVEHLGAVDYFLALGYRTLDDPDRARRHCAAARELLARLDNRPWQRRADELAATLP